MKVLEFIFSSFWTFIGTVILLELILTGIVQAIRAIRRTPEPKDKSDED